MVYTRDEQLIAAGAQPYRLGTDGFWFGKLPDGAYDYSHVDLSTVETLIDKYGAETTPLLIDIEAFDLAENHAHAVEQLRVAAEAWRAGSNRPLGFYGLVPERNWWVPIKQWQCIAGNDGPNSRRETAAWRERNTRNAAALLDCVDFLCPSLYAFYDNQWTNWRVYAEATLDEAARVSHGKPIWPIVWAAIHPGNAPIPLGAWAMMLDWTLAHPHVQSIIVYSAGQAMHQQWRGPVLDLLTESPPAPSNNTGN